MAISESVLRTLCPWMYVKYVLIPILIGRRRRRFALLAFEQGVNTPSVRTYSANCWLIDAGSTVARGTPALRECRQ